MLAWSDDDLAYLRHGHCSFLLQNFYSKEHADNFMTHLLVSDVGAWWRRIEETGLVVKYARERRATCRPALGHARLRHH